MEKSWVKKLKIDLILVVLVFLELLIPFILYFTGTYEADIIMIIATTFLSFFLGAEVNPKSCTQKSVLNVNLTDLKIQLSTFILSHFDNKIRHDPTK